MRGSRFVVIATKNEDKRKELERLLLPSDIKVKSLADFGRIRGVPEEGKTYERNAEKKARVYSKKTRSLVLADDSGLEVNALGGRPGVYSARFAGPGCSYSDNNRKLLRLLRVVAWPKRKARFVCAISIYDSGKKVATVRGECEGRIGYLEKGTNGFGYDPVFIPKAAGRTCAELSSAEKNRLSHRGKALHKAKKALLRYLKTL